MVQGLPNGLLTITGSIDSLPSSKGGSTPPLAQTYPQASNSLSRLASASRDAPFFDPDNPTELRAFLSATANLSPDLNASLSATANPPRSKSSTELKNMIRGMRRRSVPPSGSRIPDAITNRVFSNDKTEGWWDTIEEIHIPTLPVETFKTIPAKKIERLSPATLNALRSDQIKSLAKPQLMAFLSQAKNLTAQKLQEIEMSQITTLTIREIISLLCHEQIYHNLTHERQSHFKWERWVFEVEAGTKKIVDSDFDSETNIAFVPRDYFKEVGTDSVKKQTNDIKIKYLNHFTKFIPSDKVVAILSSLPLQSLAQCDSAVFDIVYDLPKEHPLWQSLVECDSAVRAYALQNLPTVHPLRMNLPTIEGRATLRKDIRSGMDEFLKLGALDAAQRTRLLARFTRFTKLNKKSCSMHVKEHLYREALLMSEFPFAKELCDFSAYGSVFFANFPSKTFGAMPPFDIEMEEEAKISCDSMRDFPKNAPTLSRKVTSKTFAGSIGTLYPLGKNDQRYYGLVADDFSFLRVTGADYNKFIIFSGSDGATRGAALSAAVKANTAFVRTVHDAIVRKEQTPLSNLFFRALDVANQSVSKTSGRAAHTGLVGYTSSTRRRWSFLASSLGDMYLYRYSRREKTCTQILGSEPLNLLNRIRSPGGQLGAVHGEFPDMGNFSLASFLAEKDDILVILSNGANDNLRPQFLGLSPKETHRLLSSTTQAALKIDANVLADKPTNWVPSEECSALEKAYRLQLLLALIESSNGTNEEIATKITQHLKRATEIKRTFMEQNPSAMEPEVAQMVAISGPSGSPSQAKATGLLDHFMCSVIDLR